MTITFIDLILLDSALVRIAELERLKLAEQLEAQERNHITTTTKLELAIQEKSKLLAETISTQKTTEVHVSLIPNF